MWITTSLMSFGTVVLLATLFPFSSSHTLTQSEAIELLQSNFTRPKRQLFREDIPHHRPLSGNHYARHHGFPHPGRWTNRPSMPVPVRPAEGDDDFGNSIDTGFHHGGGNNYHHGLNNYGSHLHTVDPTTVTIHNDIIHEDGHGHGGENFGHGHSHPHPHPPPPPPPPPPHHEEPSYGGGHSVGGYGEGGGGYGNGGGGGYVEYGRGHEGGRYGHGTGGGGYQGGGGGGVQIGHNNAIDGPHKTVVHYHPVQFGNFLPVGGESEGVTYSPQNGYGPQSAHTSGPEVSTGFSGGGGGGGYSSGPSHSEHHGGDSASFTENGSGSPHYQHHPHPHHHHPHPQQQQPHRHYPPGKEPIGVPIAIPVITHFHQSRPRRPKPLFGSHHHGGVKFPTYVVHGHKPRRRPYFSFRRPNKARWIVNYGH